MNGFGIFFLLCSAIALLTVPRRWAPLPFLVGACYMTLAQKLVLGPFNFSVIRILISIGWVRILSKHELSLGKLTNLDRALLLWGGWSLCCTALHADPTKVLVFHLGVVYNALGFYFLIRAWCRDHDEIVFLIQIIAIMLVPLAIEMALEQLTGSNLFAIFGRVDESVTVRGGRFRAQGPFVHAILAGSVAAGCVPLMLGIWGRKPLAAKIGLGASATMIIASASSGPIMSALFGAFALALWRWRRLTGALRIGAVLAYISLDTVMTRPAYFVISKFDLTGSSTGHYRAALIRSYIAYFNQWWMGGTDNTAKWMPMTLRDDPNNVDITNQYILQGVYGGLPLMALFMIALGLGFRYAGKLSDLQIEDSVNQRWFAWTLGACLFSHATSFMSVSYFDQSFVFYYLPLAAISSLYARSIVVAEFCSDDREYNPNSGDEPETDVASANSNT